MCTGGPASRFTTGQCGTLTTNQARRLPSLIEPNQETYGHDLHECVDCGAVFKCWNQLQCHIKTKHAHRRFVCTQCKRTFAHIGSLKEHVKNIHEKLAKYQCETCGKGYSRPSHYHDHLATHTGVKRNICPICQSQFTFKHDLKVHLLHFHPSDAAHS